MKGDRISSLLGIIFAGYIVRQSWVINIGGIRQPGPGFFLLVAAMLLAVCSTVVFVQSLVGKAPEQDGQKAAGKGDAWLIGAVLGVLILNAIFFAWLGFTLATFFLVLLLMLILEPQKWWKMLLTAGLTSAGAYVIFNLFLKSGLPEGILGSAF